MEIIKIGAIWCPACIMMKNYYEEIKNIYNNRVIFKDLDLDFDEEVVEQYNIGDTLPVIIFIKDKKEVKRLIGEKSMEEIIDSINEVI